MGDAHGRVTRAIGASTFSQVASLFIQFATLPALLHAWGATTYGLWLVLSAVPAYLAMGDFGFGQAAASDMTIAVARGDTAGANRTLHSILAFTGSATVLIGLAAIIAVVAWPAQGFPQSGAPVPLIRVALAALIGSSLSMLAWTSITATLRAGGRLPLATFTTDLIRLAEAAVIVAVAFMGCGIVVAAVGALLIRTSALALGFWLLNRAVPWASVGFSEATALELKRLAGPAFAVTVMPLGFAFALQGQTLATSHVIGLAAVAALSTVRTLSRLIVQACTIISYPLLPEISRAYGLGRTDLLRKYILLLCSVTFALAAILGVGEVFLAPAAIRLLTQGKIAPSHLFIGLVVVSAALQAAWTAASTALLAVNHQKSYSYWFVLTSAGSVLMTLALAPRFNLLGVGISMVVCDALMAMIVIPRAVRLAQRPISFIERT